MEDKRNKRDRPVIDTDEITIIDNVNSRDFKEKLKSKLNVMLTIIQGSEIDFGKTYNLTDEFISIGRNPKVNTIAVNDAKVSKKHCEISVIKTNDLEQIVIKDLSSTNGTYVNGELIQQRILGPGDKISIGATVLRFSYNDEIEEEYHSKLFAFAAIDTLTGLYNRRYTFNELENQLKIAKRNERIFSLIMLDIDDFKKINDTYGHQAGDEYLKKIAFIINHTLREQDIPGRVGGEEFLIILPETNLDGAQQLANRIRERVENTPLIYKGANIKTTISAGISQYEPKISIKYLYQKADVALYKAKQMGKNRVIPVTKPEMNSKNQSSDSNTL